MRGTALGAAIASVVGCNDGTAPDAGLPTQPIVLMRLTSTGWDIVRTNPDGTGEVTLTPEPYEATYPSWSPNHTRIAFLSSRPDASGVFIMNADGSGQRLAFRPPSGLIPPAPAWAPDQQWLAYGNGSFFESSVVRIRLDGTQAQTLGEGRAPSWSPDGSRIAFTTGSGFDEGVDDGIDVSNIDGRDRRSVIKPGLDPAWSRDGRRIAYAAGEFGASFIYTVNVDGTDRRRITTEMPGSLQTTDLSPVWSPDGRWIAFQRQYSVCTGQPPTCTGGYNIFVIRSGGTDMRQVTKDGESVRPSW
jgi:Tol biopolymer transport system component